MAKIQVKAKITGTHALSGLYVEEGQTYEIEEEHFGDEVFDNLPANTMGQAGKVEGEKVKGRSASDGGTPLTDKNKEG